MKTTQLSVCDYVVNFRIHLQTKMLIFPICVYACLIQIFLRVSNCLLTDDHKGKKEARVQMVAELSIMEKKPDDNLKGKLMQEEEKEEGSVSIKIYWLYARSIGLFFSFLLILTVASKQIFLVAVDFWLAEWSSSFRNHSETDSQVCI